MELRRLRYFRHVVEAGGVTKAARILGVTPGALSKALTQLQSELDAELFVRSGRGLALTETGRALYNASDRVVDEYDRMLATVTGPKARPDRELRIASFEPLTTHTLAAAIAGMASPPPLRVLEVGVPKICEAVALREADVGLTYVPFLRPELNFRRLCTFRFSTFVAGRRFAGRTVTDIPFAAPVTTISGSATDLIAVDGWPADKIPRTIRYHLTSLESALALVRQGLCAVFLPDFVAGVHNDNVRRSAALRRLDDPPGMKAVVHAVQLVTRVDDDARRYDALAAAVRATIARGAQRIVAADAPRR